MADHNKELEVLLRAVQEIGGHGEKKVQAHQSTDTKYSRYHINFYYQIEEWIRGSMDKSIDKFRTQSDNNTYGCGSG